jgi:hypothetical protein
MAPRQCSSQQEKRQKRHSHVPLPLPPSWVPQLCAPSSLLGPAAFVAVHRCLACLVLMTRSAMTRFPFLAFMSLSPLSLLPMLLLPHLLTVMMKLSFHISHTALLWLCVMVMLMFLSRTPMFLAFPPPPPLLLLALNLQAGGRCPLGYG